MHLTLVGWRVAIERVFPDRAELAQLYDRAAPTWNAGLRRIGHDSAYGKLFRHLVETGQLAAVHAQTQVLDAGIGAAAFSLALVQASDCPPQLVGVDYSLGMVREARRQLAAVGVDALLHHQDAQHLSFADASFDLVISAHLLEHLPDPSAGIAELVRVLRPGGTIVLVVTRPGIIDSLLQLRWRYRSVPPAQVPTWLAAHGCSDITWMNAHSLGVAIIARKA